MKLKNIALLSSLMLLFSTFTPVSASSVDTSENRNPDFEIVPEYRHTYFKTVVRGYSTSLNYIPTSIYYSEFNTGFNTTFSGSLRLTNVQKNGSYYVATYSGTLAGSWN